MPLNDNAARLIRENLEAIKSGGRGRLVVIGTLTPEQLAILNAEQARRNFPPMVADVLFVGRHVYKSRCIGNGYTIDDVIEQITGAMHEGSIVNTATKMNVLISQIVRVDAYGNQITEKAVLECTARHPSPELF
jgi:hypothetical protein